MSGVSSTRHDDRVLTCDFQIEHFSSKVTPGTVVMLHIITESFAQIRVKNTLH